MRYVSNRSKFGLCLLFCALLIGSSVLIFNSVAASYSQSTVAEQEPNETIAQANPITLPAQYSGSVMFGDAADFEFVYGNGPKDKIEDFFKFTIPDGPSRRVDVVLTFSNPAADLDLFLFNQEGNNLTALAVSNGGTTTERITPILTLGPGTYLIGVSAYDDPSNTADGSYTLSATQDTAAPAPIIERINPVSAIAGGGPFSVTVYGKYFINAASVVRWNGQVRNTTFISETQLVAFLSASDIATTSTATITVANPSDLGGLSNAVSFPVLPPGSAELEVEPNETSQLANLLLVSGKRMGRVAVGDTAQTTISFPNGASDPVEDMFAVNLAITARLDVQLNGTNPNADLALYLFKETGDPAQLTTIDNSRLKGPIQRLTTASMLAPGRYLVGVSAVTGSSDYIIEAGIIVPGFEADVSPRPSGSGDGRVTVSDWAQVGRFVAGLESPVDGSEYQRTDCAPRTTLGDGRLTIADWVVAGLYAAGLETPVPAGGPVTSSSTLAGAEKSIETNLTSVQVDDQQQQERTVRVKEATFQRGLDNELQVELVSQGNENAIGFSLNFDITQLAFIGASLGADATAALLNINTTRLTEGRIGIGLALPSGQAFAAGIRQVVRVSFNVPQNSSVNSTTVSFGDLPIARETADVNANVLPAIYTPGVITINPPVNLVPSLTSLDPGIVIVRGPSFTLTVNGANFVNGAVVLADGVARVTQFVSSSQLRANILPQDIIETGTLSITVQNPPPGGGVSNALNLSIVNPVPTLTTIDPSSAAVGSRGFTLIATGTNFVPGATVQFNGNNRVTTFVGTTQLNAQLLDSDLATAGTANVQVVNPEPGGGSSNTLAFTISTLSPIPRIADISPPAVTAGNPGFTLTVNGSSFVSTSVVRFNGNPLPTTFVSSTELTAQVSAENVANPGTASISVSTPAPGGGNSNAVLLTINAPPNPVPILEALNPNTVAAGSPRFTLTVTGQNFVSNSVVRFNNQDRLTTFISATELRAVITENDVQNGGTAGIRVFNPAPAGGLSNEVPLTISFILPAIATISPSAAVAGGPAFTLAVVGTNFAPGSVVRWNGENRATTFVSVTELSAEIPATDIANVGSATVTVFSPAAGGGLSNGVIFTITQAARPLPRITSISPETTLAGGPAFTLIVIGTNFVSDSVVRWNGSPRPTTFVNSTQLTAEIPASDIATAGTASVSGFTSPPGGGDSNSLTFNITTPPNPAPVITTINPSTVNTGGAAFVLTVNGSGFALNSSVQLNGEDRPTTFVSTNQLTAQISALDIAAAGSAKIRVVTPAPGGGTSNEVLLAIINPVPSITLINPSLVAEGTPGLTLTVTGTGFVPGAEVRLNGVRRVTSFVNSTQLTAQIPASDLVVAATLSIQVFNPEPGGGLSNTASLVVAGPNPLPRITGLNPEVVNAGGPGFTLVVNGSSFVRGSVVRVNGQDRVTDFVSDTALAAQILASDIAVAGALPITVFNPAPGGGRSNPFNLIINNPRPRITSISPDTGPAGAPGFVLIVNGEGFVSASVVQFNGINVPTTLVTSTQLNASIPAAAVAGGGAVPVAVFNPEPGGGTSNAITFTINPLAPVITSLTPDQVLVGGDSFTLTINGDRFVSGSIVRIDGLDRLTTFLSSTQLTVVIQAADIANAGSVNVTVVNPDPASGTSNTVALAVNNPLPILTSLSPGSAAPGSAGFTLTINGTGFVTVSVAQWNGSPRQTTFVSGTQLTIQVTAADVANVGVASVTVINPAPGGGTSNTLPFTIGTLTNPVPVLVSLNPSSVPVGSAAFILTVNGSDFVPGAVVQLDGSARLTTFVSTTQLTAQILATDVANVVTYNLSVVNPAPGGGLSNILPFTVTPPNPVPALDSLIPSTATVGSPAFTITVNGTNFVNGAAVMWNGTLRQTTFVSATQLTAQVTAADVAALGTASVTVVNPAPGGGSSNALTFTINAIPNPVPVLDSLNPSSATEGDEALVLIVTGTNFVAGASVQWNGSSRPTVFVSGTQLAAQISKADLAIAGTANITVLNPAPGGGQSNTLVFTVNPLILSCTTICLRSAAFYSLNPGRLPDGSIVIGGVNFNRPLLVQTNEFVVLQALAGGSSPLQQLNQQYVATQLNVLSSNVQISSIGLRSSRLRCYNVDFAPVQLSNGFTLTIDTLFGDFMDQTYSAIVENRSDDMLKLAMIHGLLNGNDPSGFCR